jgi:hypothetical protein
MWRKVVAVSAVVWLLLGFGASPALAKDGYAAEMGYGLAAVGANLLYVPAKIVYAVLGGVTGGLGFLVTAGNTNVAQTIWSPALGGTYVLSPAMLRGDEPILFCGESYEPGRR